MNGCIHRDVKAANLLIDDDGTVLLGDLGVAADLSENTSGTVDLSTSPNIKSFHDTGSSKRQIVLVEPESLVRPRMGKRKSFVGTVSMLLLDLVINHS